MKGAVGKAQTEKLKDADLCTATEAAEILKLSRTTIYKRKAGTKTLTRIRRVIPGQRERDFFVRAEVLALKTAKETAVKPKPKIGAKIPEKDQRLEPWDSIIHWTETYYSRRTKYKGWVTAVTCGFCGTKRDARLFDLKPESGVLNPDCLRNPTYEYKHLHYTGLCRPCLSKINHRNVKLPDGSELFLSQRTKEGLPIRCGACQSGQTLKCSISTNIHSSHWPCPSCGHIIGRQTHISGAIVYWLKFKGGNQTSNVAYECKTCHGESFVKSGLCVLPGWSGNCAECRKERPTRAIYDDQALPGTKQMAYYSERKGKRIPVACGLRTCPRKPSFNIGTVTLAAKEGKLLFCRDHTRGEIAQALQAQTQNGSAGDEKARQFREAVNAAAEAWDLVRSGRGTFEHRLKKVDLLEIGAALGVPLDWSDDVKSRNRVVRKLKSLGVYEVYPAALGGYPAFVRAVAEGIEGGTSREEVALRLWGQHPAGIKPA